MTENDVMTDDELQRQYYELKSIDDHIKKLDHELGAVDSKISELEAIKGFVREVSSKSGSETLIPITDGIFVKAKLLEQGEFVVNVGSGVCVPKSTTETLSLLDQQSDELLKYRDQIVSKMETLDKMAQGIEAEFLKRDNARKTIKR